MKILVVDVGGTSIKILATGEDVPRKFPSGADLTAQQMVEGVLEAARGWAFDVVSIGFPGPVRNGRPAAEPVNLGTGWVDFDYDAAFGKPVRMINDAAMQALGSYEGGRMLFLGLGTGLGSTLILDGVIGPMELGHLPYRKATFETYVGTGGAKRFGRKKWREFVEDVVDRLVDALLPDYVVLGGGNVKKLKKLPASARQGNNANAFLGGFRLWEPGTPALAMKGETP